LIVHAVTGISVQVDADHGGRWVSLRSAAGREWLWSRHAPQRAGVHPGDAFVDAGGLEECIPTIGGVPDHGDAWARPWRRSGDALIVDGDAYRLRRSISTRADTATASYRLAAAPGWRFIWAAHALLDLSPSARLLAPAGHPTTVVGTAGESQTAWPWLGDVDLSRVSEADGTALMITLTDLDQITVVDQGDRLTMSLSAAGAPTSVAIWRNLGGWPEGAPYRSIGVEPMLGRTGELSLAGPGDAATVPPSGSLDWSLAITADRSGPGPA
jgi:hypothetical protein